MKTIFLFACLLASALILPAIAEKLQADETPKQKAVGALPPHPLDSVFENAATDRAAVDKLINNELLKKAIAEALKAKKEQEQRYKDNPNLRDATPAQKARQKFLEVLQAGQKEALEKK